MTEKNYVNSVICLKRQASEYCYSEFSYCYGTNDRIVSEKKETQAPSNLVTPLTGTQC